MLSERDQVPRDNEKQMETLFGVKGLGSRDTRKPVAKGSRDIIPILENQVENTIANETEDGLCRVEIIVQEPE